MSQLHFTSEDWKISEGRYWSTLFNSISGPRSAVMIGTQDQSGIGNIGLFNSLVHLGANPPLLGFVLRPTSVSRNTYQNLISSGRYTLQHGTVDLLSKVHQTSAKYDATQDEFEEIGFEKTYINGFQAPFIQGLPISLGMEFREEHLIQTNNTRLIVGEVKHILINESLIEDDGYIDTSMADTILVSGLDAYHRHDRIKRMAHARP